MINLIIYNFMDIYLFLFIYVHLLKTQFRVAFNYTEGVKKNNQWQFIAIKLLCTTQDIFQSPVSTRHRFDIHTTFITLKRRRTDVKTTSCAYWVILISNTKPSCAAESLNARYVRQGIILINFKCMRFFLFGAGG